LRSLFWARDRACADVPERAFGATDPIWAPNSDIKALEFVGWHPDLATEHTRRRNLGIWAPLIEPQQVELASVAPRSSNRPRATFPGAELPI
jgi:hypothetical protein